MDDPDFENAADAFVALADGIPDDAWNRPGLGVWSVRDLVGHTCRSFTTVETGLQPGTTTDRPDLADAATYYRWVSTQNSDPEAVADRGRQAAATLGARPATTVRELAGRVRALVRATPPDTVVTTLGGTMTLAGYLPTRTFELTMHSLDLARALGVQTPPQLGDPVDACARLAAELALRAGHGTELLLALGGRQPLDPGLSVMI